MLTSYYHWKAPEVTMDVDCWDVNCQVEHISIANSSEEACVCVRGDTKGTF